MNELGNYVLCVGWFLALYGIFSGVYAGLSKRETWYISTVNAVKVVAFCSVIATLILGYGFCVNDYVNQYIWQYSSRDMSLLYKLTAIWGGMDGSILLWCGILGVCSGVVAYQHRLYPRALMPWVLAVISSSLLFFMTVAVFLSNPFRFIKAPFIPPDGNGLNPLLQNPYMAAHPPTLYVGFAAFSIPFAFCIASLIAGRTSNEWLAFTRRWTIVAWIFLTIGIVLGAYWAYIELGWGGFWAWDPVENSSFMPWIIATAFLHSTSVQKRRDMLKFWNVWMVSLTYGLTIFGTFLTRSGIVQSVHSFASTDIGWFFLLYIAIIFVVTVLLTYWRRSDLKANDTLESLLSRETIVLVNNLLLISICFATFWGVMFPVFSEAVTGSKQAVGAPFFNAVNVPLFLVLLFLTGAGPLVAWRKNNPKSLGNIFMLPVLGTIITAIVLFFSGVDGLYPLISFSLCAFILLTIISDFVRQLKTQSSSASASLLSNIISVFKLHHIRYGSHLIHFGVAVAALGITASMAFKVEKEFALARGASYELGRFKIRLDSIDQEKVKNYERLYAALSVKSAKDGKTLTVLHPELRYYTKNRETTTEVAIRKGWGEDLYVVLAGLDNTQTRATIKAYINPLQVWLWVGTFLMVIGGLIVLIPEKQEQPASGLNVLN